MTTTNPPRPLLGFNVMLQAEDDRGLCFLAYGCAARDADEAAKLVQGAALAEGFWQIEVEEVWRPEGGDESNLGEIPEVFGRLEPTYLDEEDPGEPFGGEDDYEVGDDPEDEAGAEDEGEEP